VLAIPFTMLRQVKIDVELPPVKQKAIQELGYGTNAKLMVGFSDRVWRGEPRSNGSVLTDLPFQLTWEATRMQPGTPGVLVDFTGGRHGVEIGEGTPAHQAELFVRDLERVYPGVSDRRTGEVRMHWPTFEYTKGSYACYLPGQWTGFGGAEGERVGNLHFCGEHTSMDFQGFMEGGCESGTRVAEEIMADLGIAKPEERKKAA
jgi:monoamine oxidase